MDTADTSPKTNTAVHPRGTAPDLPRTPSPPLPGPRDARAGQTLNSQPPHSRVYVTENLACQENYLSFDFYDKLNFAINTELYMEISFAIKVLDYISKQSVL